MSSAVFPTLKGLGFSSHKIPLFSTSVQSRQSGREVRAVRWSYPIYQFVLPFNYLRTDGAWTDMQTLLGFFLARQGQFDTFLYVDPTDNLITSQVIGVGDGVTTSFPVVRNMGGWIEPVGEVTNVPTVTVGGVAATTFTITQPNAITFPSAPALGAPIAVQNCAFAFVCRFQDDSLDLELVMTNWWQVSQVKFQSVKP